MKARNAPTAESRCILFLVRTPANLGWNYSTYLWLATRVGFRSYVASWDQVRVTSEGTFIRGGLEVFSARKQRKILRWEPIAPDVIMSRNNLQEGRGVLVGQLRLAHPDALVSSFAIRKGPGGEWAPGGKWAMERTYRGGLRAGISVPRPFTYLVKPKTLRCELRELGATRSLVFKPARGARGEGLRVSTPKTFAKVLDQVVQSPGLHVVQDLIPNPMLYRGHKFDLRIYLMVASVNPLKLRIYREGVARVAREEYDAAALDEPLRFFTIDKKRTLDLPISSLLPHLERRGYRVDDFWERAEELLSNAIRCQVAGIPVASRQAAARAYYFLGADVMLTDRGRTFDMLLLETNSVPQLNAPHPPRVHRALQAVHLAWLQDLWDRAGEIESARGVRK